MAVRLWFGTAQSGWCLQVEPDSSGAVVSPTRLRGWGAGPQAAFPKSLWSCHSCHPWATLSVCGARSKSWSCLLWHMSSISVIASCVFAASQSSFKQISTENQTTAAAMAHNPSLAVVQNCTHFDMLAASHSEDYNGSCRKIRTYSCNSQALVFLSCFVMETGGAGMGWTWRWFKLTLKHTKFICIQMF